MSESLMARYIQAQDPYSPEDLAKCRHPQWTCEWLQTGEKGKGCPHFAAVIMEM